MQTFNRHIIALAIVSILGAMGSPLMFAGDQSISLEVFEIIEIEEESKNDCEEEMTSFDQDEDSASIRYNYTTNGASQMETHFQLSFNKNVFWTIDQPPRL